MTWLEDRISSGALVILDGAIGTELERRGVTMDDDAWCARAIMSDPDKLRELHVDNIEAGADVITANTFANHRYALEPAGLAPQLETITRRAVELAQQAREATGSDRPVAIAGSMSHMPALAHSAGIPDVTVAAAHYRELSEILANAGCELLIAEMLTYPGYSEVLVEAAQASGLPVWVGFSVDIRDGRVVCGTKTRKTADLELADLARAVLAKGAVVAGVMHSEVENTDAGLTALQTVWDGVLLAYPNSGDWTPPNWVFDSVIGPEKFAEAASGWIEKHHVQVIGGCCGIGPDHIRVLKERVS